MACLFKRKFYRYVDDDGKEVRKDTPGAVKVTRQGKEWYAKYTDADGRTRTKKLHTNKLTAQTLLGELLKEVEENRGGDARTRKEMNRPVQEHIDEFIETLESRGRSQIHRDVLKSRCEATIKECGFGKVTDIIQSKVEWFLGRLRDKGRSQQTINHYIRAIKQFVNWLVDDERIDRNRLSSLRGSSVNHDRRLVRRELSSAEIECLLNTTSEGPVRRHLTGTQRVTLYSLALCTGLRSAEMAKLEKRHLDLHSGCPTVTVDAENDKARRGAELPLSSDIVQTLKPYVADLAADDLLFPGKWPNNRGLGALLKSDLADAREAWIDDACTDAELRAERERSDFLKAIDSNGERVDFHALRHTFLSRLGRAGVPAKVMQLLARHSTVELTIGRYTHAGLVDLASAVEDLPKLNNSAQNGNGFGVLFGVPTAEVSVRAS